MSVAAIAMSLKMMLSVLTYYSLLALAKLNVRASTDVPSLYLKPGTSTFKLSVFSDLHYGENEDSFGIAQDINSTKLMTAVLSKEQPDFVILNGDLITGENTFAFNSTKYVDKIVAPLVEGGYNWSSTYGNHDSKYNLTREGIYQEEKKYANSYTQHGPTTTDGVTNYWIPIYRSPDAGVSFRLRSRQTAAERPLAILWFFDSRGGSRNDPKNVDNIPNWVSASTSAWFQSTSQSLQQQYGVLPSLAFVHIPVHAFTQLQKQSKPKPVVSGKYYPGLNADTPLAFQGPSAQNNGTYTGQDVPFMRALLNTPGLHSVYSGHDHGDSWCGRWPDRPLYGEQKRRRARQARRPFLCFCKHSGFGGYGSWNRGVRQVELVFDESGGMQVNTWVRMQQGTIVTAVSLNSTYGEDVYPTATGGYHPY